jgi:hypothetical protein
MIQERHIDEAALAKAGIRIRPLAWRDECTPEYRLFSADTEFGRFVYGTDGNGVPYMQDQGRSTEVDHPTEAAAKTAVEASYLDLVIGKIASLTVPFPTDGGQ